MAEESKLNDEIKITNNEKEESQIMVKKQYQNFYDFIQQNQEDKANKEILDILSKLQSEKYGIHCFIKFYQFYRM